jgi:hypothetical protein
MPAFLLFSSDDPINKKQNDGAEASGCLQRTPPYFSHDHQNVEYMAFTFCI